MYDRRINKKRKNVDEDKKEGKEKGKTSKFYTCVYTHIFKSKMFCLYY